ncbi:hypothetical protein O181_070843 [Austropuccinia psidii MF-1]|uniref:Uncharacterized protein n=1 Tax=Austropuccinia psidii MF-1 TaxID=1389203 RepID=A0A9Q3I7N3_9BASI|nr:hypothetical protein [Austropuccinia psidii MF-1]
MSSYLHIKRFLGKEKTIKHLEGWSHCQKDKELVEEPKSFIHRPEERVGNDPSFGEGSPSGINKLQARSRSFQRQASMASEKSERSQEQSGQRERQSQFAQTLPTRVQDSKIGIISHGKCIQYGQNPYGIHRKGVGKDEQDFSTQIKDEIK